MLPDQIEIELEPKQSTDRSGATYNPTLDDERKYSTVDLLKYVDDSNVLKRLSIQVSQATHLPVNTVFLMSLAVFASMAARQWCVLYPSGRRLPIGIYAVAEQPPGTGKTWCLSVFQQPFYDIHKSMRDSVLKKIKRFEARLTAKETLPDDEIDELAELRDFNARISVPVFVSNATPEGLEKALEPVKGFFGAVSSEQGLFGSLFGALYKNGEVAANNNDLILNGYDGGYISTLRVTRNGYHGHVVGGVACFAQDGSIERLFAASNGTGLAERFLCLVEPHMLGRRDHLNQSLIDASIENEYVALCRFFRNVLESPFDFYGLRKLVISQFGHEMIADYRNDIEPMLVDGGQMSHVALRGAASKINMQIMKLAAVLHLSSGFDEETEIGDRCLHSAIGIANDLLEANLSLCVDKGLQGSKAEFSAILALFEKDSRPRTERAIIQANVKKQPFKEFSGNKSDLVRSTLEEMVNQRILSRVIVNNAPGFMLAQ